MTYDKSVIRDIVISTANSLSYSPNRLLAQIYHESKYNPNACTNGRYGLGQFDMHTAQLIGCVDKLFDPQASSQAICKYMKYLQVLAGNWGITNELDQWRVALACYSSGTVNISQTLISAKLTKGSGIKLSPLKKFDWKNLANKLPEEIIDYVSKIEQYAKNPP